MVGMRSKSPRVLDAVRRTGRAMRPLAMKSSGTAGGNASVVRHVGRKTGRPFETPVKAVATDDGFVIALPYGRNTDWLKNVLASGSATILDEGNHVRSRAAGDRSALRRRAPLLAQGPTHPSPVPRRRLPPAATRRHRGTSVSVAAVKAAVLETVPGELVIDDVQIGTVGPHEVLVQTAAAGLVPLRPPLHGGQVPAPGAGGARPRVGRRRRGGRFAGDLRAARRPRDLVHQRLLRRVPLLPLGSTRTSATRRGSRPIRPARRGCDAAINPSTSSPTCRASPSSCSCTRTCS